MEKTKNKLGVKLLVSIIIMAVLLIIVTCLAVSLSYAKNRVDDIRIQAYYYAKSAADLIDGDKIAEYIETNQKDDYYEKIQNYLNITQKNSDLLYYYVYVPTENDLIYVWDADNIAGYCELGQHEAYLDGGKEASQKAFKTNPSEDEIMFSKSDTYGRIASAYYPVFDGKGQPCALVGVDLSVKGIGSDLFNFISALTVSITVIVFIFILCFCNYTNKKLVFPIKKLNTAALAMISNLENDENTDIDIHTNDEIEELANSFVRMNHEIRDYIKKLSVITAEKERIGAELNVATQIQADMLPSIYPAFPGRREFDIYASMCPAKEVGGDFYDFFFVDDDHLALVMADVSGKGVPAALFMVIAKTLIKNRTLMGGTPSEIMYDVNNQLCEGNDAEMFVTVWLCIMETSTGKCVASNAGHEYPAIRRGNGKFELYKQKHSPAVATLEDMNFRQYEFKLEPGDSIFVYTDGVAEATDLNNKLFGTDRMLCALNKNPHLTAEKLLNAVHDGIDEFVGEAPQFDDVTMLCLDYFGKDGLKS